MPSFNELLQSGEIDSAIQLRLDTLEDTARGYRTDCEGAKISSALATVLGVGMSANPLIGFIGLLAAVGYGYTVARDYQLTKRFCPIPGIRKGAAQLFEAIAGASNDETETDDPLLDVMSFLAPAQAHEYELLSVSDAPICKMLAMLPAHKRAAGYSYLLRQTRLRNSLHLPSLADTQEAIALLPGQDETISQGIGINTRLNAVNTAAIALTDSESVEDWLAATASEAPTPATAQADGDTSCAQVDQRYAWTKDLINFPAVLIWGAQGSGKTSFTAWLLRERLKAGHSAEVWDVHREYGQWQGLSVFGDGMDYDAVDSRMLAFERQVKADYKERASNPKYSPKRHTVVCEEFTNFARRCEHSAPFFEAALSDLRKVKKGVIFVSHGRTLTAVGGSKGFGKTRDNGLVELELEARIDPVTGDPVPALKGKLRLPGREAIAVDIATWMNGSMDFSSATQATPTPPATTQSAAPAPAKEETHKAVSQAGLQASEMLKKIGQRVAERIKAANGEWVSLSALTRELFGTPDDRTTAKELIDRAVANGTLEMEERENPNKTTTVFVRVSQSLFF